MSNFVRLVAIGLAPIALAACAGPSPIAAAPDANTQVAMAVDLGSSARAPSVAGAGRVGEGHEWGSADHGMAQRAREEHGGPQASGTVNSVDVAHKTVNVSHGPIPELGWPPMTMEFPVAPGVDLKSVKAGSRVTFSLGKGKDGMYEINALQPAGGK